MTAYWRQLTLVGCNCRQLHRDPSVLFAGYKLPHPLQYKMVVKVRSSLSFLMAKKPAQLHHPIVFYHLLMLSLNMEYDWFYAGAMSTDSNNKSVLTNAGIQFGHHWSDQRAWPFKGSIWGMPTSSCDLKLKKSQYYSSIFSIKVVNKHPSCHQGSNSRGCGCYYEVYKRSSVMVVWLQQEMAQKQADYY